MKLTILTVCYNSGATIRDTLESLVHQTDHDFEYIVVDGASTDRTLEIIKEYEDRLPMRLLSEPDNGLYDALNKGIHMASGDVVGLLNSDDYYEPTTVQLVKACFTENPSMDFLCGAMRLVTYKKEEIRVVYNQPLERIVYEMPLNEPATFVRKSVYDEIGGFNPKYRVSADYDFTCRAYIANKRFKFISDVLTNMRMGGLSGGGDGGIQGIRTAIQTAKDDYEIVRLNFGKTYKLRFLKKYILLHLRMLKRYFFKSKRCR